MRDPEVIGREMGGWLGRCPGVLHMWPHDPEVSAAVSDRQ